MFLHFGHYVTESSGHNSEYNAWFRKRPDLIEKYCSQGTGWNPGEYAYSLNLRLEREDTWQKEIKEWLLRPLDISKSKEYASDIFNACFGDNKLFSFNGNVLNKGSISNLPYNSCVEIPVMASKNGFQQTIVGELPHDVAILVNTTAHIEDLAVEAALTKNKHLVYSAVYMDPLCSAVCSLDEMKQMVDELFVVNKDFLGDYK